jgi:hypothetical protein
MLANPRETVARVSEAITELHAHGFIHRYSADGTQYLYLSWWDSTQRIDKPGRGRFPRPDGTMDYKASVIRDSVASPPETLAPVTGEQGNRGTVSSASADAEREFTRWYAAYPRKKDRARALKAYKAALKKKGVTSEKLLTVMQEQTPVLMRKGVEFCPYPASWLNGERWDDEPDEVGMDERPERPRNYRDFGSDDDRVSA